ncbi:uncharacterized protein [Rutidosis leptorrhynchoides]|uniref:uncharacterized protein n=1 Tax=Rutidosis leptorrhynchoides TaxID=125765 RepID=UPI003A99BA70
MHVKSDSDLTSVEALTPPRSPRRPLYYVQSPSNNDANDKMSYGSSPFGSPGHPTHYHCSPIHHSRESSTSRTFSASIKNTIVKPNRTISPWKRIEDADVDDDVDDDDGFDDRVPFRFYVVWFVVSFILLFTIFSLILWAASVPYKPKIFVKSMVFDNFNVQSGMDATGVPTDMLTLNTTVKIFYRNPATFFGVHVTVSPIEIRYFQLKLASGNVDLVKDRMYGTFLLYLQVYKVLSNSRSMIYLLEMTDFVAIKRPNCVVTFSNFDRVAAYSLDTSVG